MKNLKMLIMAVSVCVSTTTWAQSYDLPLHLDYGLIKKVITSQLFKGQDGAAEVWKDKHECSFLRLYNPRVSGEHEQVKLLNDVKAQFGTSFGGKCIPVIAWEGALETFQKPTISADQRVLSLPVTLANAYDRQGQKLAIDQLRDIIKQVAEPKLAGIKIDLNQSRGDMEKSLNGFLPKQNAGDVARALDTLKFNRAIAGDKGFDLNLVFDAPLKKPTVKSEAPFSLEEQKQWEATWLEWDNFLSKAIEQVANDTQSPQLRASLNEILTESRVAFKSGLTAQSPDNPDPVRVFFTHAWQKMAPQLRTLAKDLPEMQSLRYLTFIAATDVIYELDSIGAPLGLEISSEGLRRILRLLKSNQLETELTP